MGEGAAVTTGLGFDPNCTGGSRPLLGSQGETVEARLSSNPVEFDGIKVWIVQTFPDS